MTAMEADAIDRKKKRQNPDPGFSDYEEATARQYNRMISNMKVDMGAYQRQRDKLGKAFYAEANTYLHDKVKDSKEGIDNMVDDLEKQYVIIKTNIIVNLKIVIIIFNENINFAFFLFSFLESQNATSSVGEERIMMKLTLIISMKET